MFGFGQCVEDGVKVKVNKPHLEDPGTDKWQYPATMDVFGQAGLHCSALDQSLIGHIYRQICIHPL